MASHVDRLVSFLKKDVGGAGLSNDQIRDFSSTLKELDLIDMSASTNAEWLISNSNGQQCLAQLVSWYTLGLLTNVKIIKQKIKEK